MAVPITRPPTGQGVHRLANANKGKCRCVLRHGTPVHLRELFKRMAKVEMLHALSRRGPALNDLLPGRVDASCSTTSAQCCR